MIGLPASGNAAYVPADRRAALVAGLSLPERAEGAALFADISGFTSITRKMIATHGARRGPEEMAGLLNALFEQLVAPVQAYRGSVIGFSGDAISCWFDQGAGDRRSPPWAIARALASALEMHDAIARTNRQYAAGQFDLGIKVAVAAGSVRRCLVGDPRSQQIDVMIGRPVDEMAQGESLAARGDTIAPLSALAPIANRLQTAPVRRNPDADTDSANERFVRILSYGDRPAADPWPGFTASQLNALEELASAWVLPSVRERISAGVSDYLAEIRPTSALFMQFAGIDYDRDEDAARKLDAVVRWAQSVFTRHEGVLLHVTVGEKGSYVNGTFGAPIAHDNDAGQAIAAAMELAGTRPADLGFLTDVSIGVSRGTLFTGAIGSASRRVYGTSGSSANLAARLMQSAPADTVWCDAGAHRSAGRKWRFDACAPIALRGFDAPVVPYQPRSAVSRSELDPGADDVTLLGRDSERTLLYDLLNAAHADGRALAWVEGAAGMGKSALIGDAVARARADGMLVFHGAGSRVETGAPYHPLRAAFTDIVARSPELPEEFDPLLCLLDTVVPDDRPVSALVRQMSAEVRAENTQRLMVAMLGAITAERPVLLIVDDVHWADSSSLLLLARAAREVSRLAIVVAGRPSDDQSLSEEARMLRESSGPLRVELTALGDHVVRQLVDQTLTGLPVKLRQRIVARAAGNPFFAIEITNSLREQTDAYIDPTLDADSIELPETIQGVVTGRIDRLPVAAQLIVKVGSVIGQGFDVALLRSVLPNSSGEAEVRRGIELLTAQKLIGPTDGGYEFSHPITRDVAYENMTFSQRRGLRERIAQWYESAGRNRIARSVVVLAHHWERAENTVKASGYLESAGDHAFDNSAHAEAAGFYRRLIELDIGASAWQGRWLVKLGRAYRGCGRFVDSRVWLEAALPLYREPAARSGLSVGWNTLKQMAIQIGHRVAPNRHGASDAVAEREIGEMYTGLAELAFFSGRQLWSIYATIRSLNALERAGDVPQLGTAYAAMGLFAGMLGFTRLQQHYQEHSDLVFQNTDSPTFRADALRLHTMYQIGVGQWEQAEASVSTAQEIHESLRDRRGFGDCLQMLIHCASLTGDYPRAARIAAELIEAAKENENPLHEAWGKTWYAKSLIRSGALDEAVSVLDEAMGVMDRISDRHIEVVTRANRALALLYRGAVGDAVECVRETLRWRADMDVEPSPTYATFQAYADLGDVCLAALERQPAAGVNPDDLAQPMRVIRNLLRAHARLYPMSRPALCLFEGRRAMLRGRGTRGMRLWREAIESADAQGMRLEAARSRYLVGSNSEQSEGAALIDDALERFDALGTMLDYAL